MYILYDYPLEVQTKNWNISFQKKFNSFRFIWNLY